MMHTKDQKDGLSPLCLSVVMLHFFVYLNDPDESGV